MFSSLLTLSLASLACSGKPAWRSLHLTNSGEIIKSGRQSILLLFLGGGEQNRARNFHLASVRKTGEASRPGYFFANATANDPLHGIA